MNNPAKSQVPLHDLIARRWSPRAFSNRAIEREKLLGLLEAWRWSASSRNEQPWSLIVALRDNKQDFERMVGCLMPSNAEWAKEAPLLILSLARMSFPDGKPNRHAFHDVGFAVCSLTMQAMAHDLWVHQMAGFDVEKARQTFSVPTGIEPVSVLAVSYYGDEQTLSETRRAQEGAPRVRKPLTEFVFSGDFRQPAAF
jgi:nitroreductase